MPITHEQIDALQGPELDAAFSDATGCSAAAESFFTQGEMIPINYHERLDLVVEAVHDGWSINISTTARWSATVGDYDNRDWLAKSSSYNAPSPATALCRAVLKAKATL